MPPLGTSRAARAGSGPVARISASALRDNLAYAVRGSGSDGVSALYADAWGHGEAWVRSILEGARVAPESVDAASLYGLPDGAPEARPVLTLSGRVLSTKALRAGEGVSYGYTYRAPEDTRIALVSGGYAQGVVRMLGNRAALKIRGERCTIVGRVAMDVCVVDVDDAVVAPGDEVVYFGGGLVRDALAEWERATGLTGAEIVCALGLRTASLGLREATEDAA